MKIIRAIYGKIAFRFWGISGLMMHSAICSASQKTMPYEGIVRLTLTAMSKIINVQNEERSISLVARLRNDYFPKFLSRSFNGNIKQLNLTGFFTLNPIHAQSVVGVAGLLKGRLAFFGISVSKNNVFSPNFHFAFSMKKDRRCPSAMLKRMATREQESSEDLDVNSNVEKIFDSDEATDTDQNRLESTTACPKKSSEKLFNITYKIKNPNTIVKTLPKTVDEIGQGNAEIYTLNDKDAAAIEILGQKRK